MRDLISASRSSVVVWAALMAATIASWQLGAEEGGGSGDGASAAVVGVLLITFVKVRFVGRHFMEVRGAPLVLRVVLDVYVVVVATALIAIHLATT